MFANYHTHTFRCHHAKGEDREYIEHAIASGFKILGFSDHCPWVYPYAYISDCRMDSKQVDGYFRSLTDLKKEYAKDPKAHFEAATLCMGRTEAFRRISGLKKMLG